MCQGPVFADVEVRFKWWTRLFFEFFVFAFRIGLIEPSIERVERVADWLVRHGAKITWSLKGEQQWPTE